MPNHVMNRVTASPDVIDCMMGLSEKGEPIVDFGRIIPEVLPADDVNGHLLLLVDLALGRIRFGAAKSGPEMAKDVRAGDFAAAADALHAHNAMELLISGKLVNDLSDEDFEAYVAMLRGYRACGHTDCLSWRIANWGTKWNAYKCQRVNGGVVTFQTAWSASLLVTDALHRQTGKRIVHEWADEDTGSNVGRCTWEDGAVDMQEMDGTKDGFELAFDLRPHYRRDYRWNGKTYEYCDGRFERNVEEG